MSDGFIERTNELLFIKVFENDICFIDIFSHNDFSNPDAVKILYKNWPEIAKRFQMKGILAPSHNYTDEERGQLRKSGLTSMIDIDGKVFIPPNMGITTSGHALSSVDKVSEFLKSVHDIRTYYENNTEELVQNFRVTNGLQIDKIELKIQFSSPPFLYPFSIVEKNSNIEIFKSNHKEQ